MDETVKKYEVEPDVYWQYAFLYDEGVIEQLAEKRGWEVIGTWGKDCYNLGSPPYVMIFFRDRENLFDVIEYSEGEVTMYACPSEAIREQITNELALFHWKSNPRSAPLGMDQYHSVAALPEALKGPCVP
jgi:hypothetical protein